MRMGRLAVALALAGSGSLTSGSGFAGALESGSRYGAGALAEGLPSLPLGASDLSFFPDASVGAPGDRFAWLVPASAPSGRSHCPSSRRRQR